MLGSGPRSDLPFFLLLAAFLASSGDRGEISQSGALHSRQTAANTQLASRSSQNF